MAICLTDISIDNLYPLNSIWADGATAFSTGLTTHPIPTCLTETQIQDLFLTSPAWALTPLQGSQIAIAIAMCWATAYVFRVLVNFLKSNEGVNDE